MVQDDENLVEETSRRGISDRFWLDAGIANQVMSWVTLEAWKRSLLEDKRHCQIFPDTQIIGAIQRHLRRLCISR